MIWILNDVVFVIVLLTNSVTAQRGRNDFDCHQAFNVTSGNPDPNDFTYATGEDAAITFTFNCTEDGMRHPWRELSFSRLIVNMMIPTVNSTEYLRLFTISNYGRRWSPSLLPLNSGKYGIKVEEISGLETILMMLDIPAINTTLNGTFLSWHGGLNHGTIGPILVKCCSLQNLPTHFKKSERKGHENCFKGATIQCKEGTMFQQKSYLPSLDVKCTADSKWEYPSDLECRDVATFDFTNKNQVLRSGKRILFVCDATNSQSVVLNKGNETILVENTLTLTPKHNGMEASCTNLNGSGTRVTERKARLNVWYPPTLDDGYVGNYSLVEESSGHVIIYFHANPRVDTNDGQVYLRRTGKQRLKKFYVTGKATQTLHKLVVDFIEVKKSDFGKYILVARSPKFPHEPLIHKFTIGRAPLSRLFPATNDQSASATEGASVLVICLASILAVCFIAMVVLAVLYVRNKSRQQKIAKQTKDAGVDNTGIYNEPNFGDYENLEVADRPSVRQEAEYVNSRI